MFERLLLTIFIFSFSNSWENQTANASVIEEKRDGKFTSHKTLKPKKDWNDRLVRQTEDGYNSKFRISSERNQVSGVLKKPFRQKLVTFTGRHKSLGEFEYRNSMRTIMPFAFEAMALFMGKAFLVALFSFIVSAAIGYKSNMEFLEQTLKSQISKWRPPTEYPSHSSEAGHDVDNNIYSEYNSPSWTHH